MSRGAPCTNNITRTYATDPLGVDCPDPLQTAEWPCFEPIPPANPQRWIVSGNLLLTLGLVLLRAEIAEISHLTQHQKAMGKARRHPPSIGQRWGRRGAHPRPHQTLGLERSAPAFLAAPPAGSAARATHHARCAIGCGAPARESPGEGCASRRSSLEQGLPPRLMGEVPVHPAPQSLLHVHLQRPVWLRLDVAYINRIAWVIATSMPRR